MDKALISYFEKADVAARRKRMRRQAVEWTAFAFVYSPILVIGFVLWLIWRALDRIFP